MADLRYTYRFASEHLGHRRDDNFVLYSDHVEVASMTSIREAARALAAAEEADEERPFLWIDMYRPTHEDLTELAEAFSLHPLAIEDAIEAHQRPKYERYGSTEFVVLRPAVIRRNRPQTPTGLTDAQTGAAAGGTRNTGGADGSGASEPAEAQSVDIKVGEIHIFLGARFIIVIRHGTLLDTQNVREVFESDTRFSGFPQFSALYRVMDRIVDNYLPVVAILEDQTDDLEERIFTGTPAQSQDIYHLSRELIELDRAVKPLEGVIDTLFNSLVVHTVPAELQRGLRDVADHIHSVNERVERLRSVLRELFTFNSTLISEAQNEDMRRMNELSIQQNEQMKKISGWAGILFFPSLVAGTYGMNFDTMPELHWIFGYPFALGLMVAGSGFLFWLFKRAGWL